MKKNKGIWKYRHFFPEISDKHIVSLNEGSTPLAEKEGLVFKLEYENPTGSLKDRGISYQISRLKEKGIKKAVISTSGNAGISAAAYCKIAGIQLTVFVSGKANNKKIKKISGYDAKIVRSPKPVSGAFIYAGENNAFNLRQSKDPNALFGFSTITYELLDQYNGCDAIFIPVSSATSFCGIYQGMLKTGKIISLHAVQTEYINPIASVFDLNFSRKEKSIADAISAKFAYRKDEAVKAINISKGSGWVISDGEILKADKWLKDRNLFCSYEGALALAGYFRAKAKGINYKKPVILLTGKYYG